MKVPFPQIDLPRGISGGRDAWDDVQAGVLLNADFFTLSSGGSFSQSCTETIILNDAIVRTSSRRLIDALTLVDTVSRVTGRSLKEWIILYDGDVTLKNGSMSDQPTFVAPTVAGSGRWIDGTASGSVSNDTWGWGTLQVDSGTITAQFTTIGGKTCILFDATGFRRISSGGSVLGINHANVYTGATVPLAQRPYLVPVKEGINYTFGGEIYVNSANVPAQIIIQIAVIYYDINLNRLGTQPAIGASVTTLGSWQSISTSGNAPTGAAFAILSARTLGQGADITGLAANFAVTNLYFRKTTAIDSIKIFLSRTFTESIVLVDSVIRTASRLFTESITVVDSVRRTIGRLLAELIRVKESEFYYQFDGVSAWAGVATGNPILPQNSPISIYCRFRTPAVFTGTYHRIMIKAYGSVSANRAGSIQLSTANRRIDFTMVDQAGTSYDLSTGNNSVNEDTEYEILGTWDPVTGTMNIYMNSPTLLATRAGGLNTPTGTSQFSYATEQNTGVPPYIAIKVKAGAVWNRVINAEEITNLFVNKSFAKNGLRLLHLFKEGSGNTVADSSGNGKTLTINNGASGTWRIDDLFHPFDGLKISLSRRLIESISLTDFIEWILTVPPSIGNWILYALTGLNKIVKFESKAHTLSTTKQSHMLLLSERSFTVSATKTTHTNRSNTTP